MMQAMKIDTLDHIALWVADRDALADLATSSLGMHVIDRTDRFTLVGSDARRGKLTLFAADGPREAGPLERIALRVRDLEVALRQLPSEADVDLSTPGEARFSGPEGLGFALVERTDEGVEYDLERVDLRVPDPAAAFDELATLGFDVRDGALYAGWSRIQLSEGDGGAPQRPLLNHLGLRVESATAHQEEAEQRGLDIADVVDGPNTLAVFVWGPGGVKLEYVEHKPSFSLV
jgi:catechol 2,3-dioxygenase-like lactoylglutathione lyase family enzyme